MSNEAPTAAPREMKMSDAHAWKLAALSKHGQKIRKLGFLPEAMPEIFRVRPRTSADELVPSITHVCDDFDGRGIVALKREDFDYLEGGP